MCGYEFETMGGKFEPLLKMNLTTKEGKNTPGDLSKIRFLSRKKVELTDMLVFYVLDWVCVCACTFAHLWGHSYVYTPAKWGLFKLWGHFQVPTKKSS